MNLKQIFCKHIWKVEKSEKLDTFIVFVLKNPVRKEIKWFIVKKCVRCGKTIDFEQEVEYALTIDEYKTYRGLMRD